MNLLGREIQLLKEELVNTSKGSRQRYLKRMVGTKEAQLKRLESGFPGRRIPDEISMAVVERDRGRNFERPDHRCEKPGKPHHIKHFSVLKNSDIKEQPHAVENLEAPCQDCHNLAHALDIPSGVSIEVYFKSFSEEEWKTIEDLWGRQSISELKIYVSQKRI